MQTKHIAAFSDFILIALLVFFQSGLADLLPWGGLDKRDAEFISSIIIIFLIGLGIAILLGKRLASLPLFGIYAGIALYAAYWSLRTAVESRFHFDDLGGAYLSYAVIVIIFSVFFAVINWLVWKTK